MDIERATDIVRHLADGVDPHTGEILPADTPYQHPDTVRALYRALEAMAASRERSDRAAARARRLPPAAGTPWTSEEDDLLRHEFAVEDSITAIAGKHGRTQGAINSRLMRLGLLGAGQGETA